MRLREKSGGAAVRGNKCFGEIANSLKSSAWLRIRLGVPFLLGNGAFKVAAYTMRWRTCGSCACVGDCNRRSASEASMSCSPRFEI